SKNNVLIGGTGNDSVTGGYYADTYVFNLGDGQDTITDYDAGCVGTDTLRFGAGILASDINTRRINSDLVFMHSNGTDQLTFKGWFNGTTYSAGVAINNVIERVEFADGTFWTWADIVATGLKQIGSEGGETLTGWSGNDIIHGGGGNDTLLGGDGANQLYGDAGDDVLIVSAASKGNTLAGGTGNDTITGSNYSDTYLFNLGDGQDTITDYDAGCVGTDTLRFGAGILASDINTRRINSDLVFMHSNGTDQLTFKDWFNGTTYSAGVAINNVIERVEFADGTFWTWADIVATGLKQIGSEGGETLTGWAGNDIIHGGGGNDTLLGGDGANQLYGDVGDDVLIVSAASKGNTLAGGTGNDTITGSNYSDTYLFNLGDGQDTITDYDAGCVGTDTLRFGAGILASDIQVQKSGTDVVFMHRNGTDQIRVKGWFNSTASSADVAINNIIERVEFADGTSWTWADIAAAGLNQVGTAAADTLVGWAGNDIIRGGAGNDTLSGGTGANQLYGDAGDDVVSVAAASKGNILAGGTGNDTITGGNFSDTYLFNRGDGQDTITDYDGGYVGTDILAFGADINPQDLWLRHTGSNLEITVIGSSEKLTVSNWYQSSNYHVEALKTADGKVLLDSQVQSLVDTMASFGVAPGAETNLTNDQRTQLDAVLAANWK
ncbi:calcium-binding protein, partial [Pseudomonas mediterranea]